MRLFHLGVLMVGAVVTAQTPNFFFNISLPLASGLFAFNGGGQMAQTVHNAASPWNGLVPGWNVTFSGSSWNQYRQGMVGLGEAVYHIEYPNYNLFPEYSPPMILGRVWGAAAYVYGSWAPYAGETATPADGLKMYAYDPFKLSNMITGYPISYSASGIIMSVKDVPMGLYRWGFAGGVGTRGGQISMTSVTLTTGLVVNSTLPSSLTIEDIPTTVIPFIKNNAVNPELDCNDKWQISAQLGGITGTQDPFVIDTLATHFNLQPLAACQFKVPLGTSMVILNGTTGPDYSGLGLKWSPALANMTELLVPTQMSHFIVPNTMLHIAMLDPTLQYTFSMYYADKDKINPGNTAGRVSLHSIRTYSSNLHSVNDTSPSSSNTPSPNINATSSVNANDTASASSTSTGIVGAGSSAGNAPISSGAIAGIVIGAVALICLILVGLWLLRRKRKTPKQPFEIVDVEPADMNNAGYPNISPYNYVAASESPRNSTPGPSGPTPRSSAVAPLTAEAASDGVPAYSVVLGGAALSTGSSLKSADTTPRPLSKTPAATGRHSALVVSAQDAEDVQVVPPQYNPNWKIGSSNT